MPDAGAGESPMIGYIVRRLVALIPLLLLISFVVFALSLLIPGDPGPDARRRARKADPAKVAGDPAAAASRRALRDPAVRPLARQRRAG